MRCMTGESREYRVAFVIKPHEAEAGRLARYPRVVDLAKVAEEVAQGARLSLGRQVANEDLHARPHEHRTKQMFVIDRH